MYKSLTLLVTFITRYLIPLDAIATGIVFFTHSLQPIPLAFEPADMSSAARGGSGLSQISYANSANLSFFLTLSLVAA